MKLAAMWFIRIALVLGVAAYLLPRDPEQQARLAADTRAAVTWTATFCDRNATTCKTAHELWTEALAKGEFAMTLAVQTIQTWNAPQTARDGPTTREPVRRADHGTLSETDRIPAWRGARSPRG